MVMGLTVQFLLGMAVTLNGQPSQTTGDARTARTVFLAAHMLVSAGMVIGAAQAAGVLTMITKSNWWSYAMATGFIASLLIYGSLLLPARAWHRARMSDRIRGTATARQNRGRLAGDERVRELFHTTPGPDLEWHSPHPGERVTAASSVQGVRSWWRQCCSSLSRVASRSRPRCSRWRVAALMVPSS